MWLEGGLGRLGEVGRRESAGGLGVWMGGREEEGGNGKVEIVVFLFFL